MSEGIVERYAKRVGYKPTEAKKLEDGGHRIRHINRLARAVSLYSIAAEVVDARHCNSGHQTGQTFLLDIDGNFITKLCPKRMCVYLVSQLVVPVALINERLSEGLEPNDFHFMRYARCLDVGVDCYGYGEVTMKIQVIPRKK